jgi:hypothetical protein
MKARRQRPANEQGDAQPAAKLPAWLTDPNAAIPLGYELRGNVHCLTLGNANEPRPVVKSALSPIELPSDKLLALAGGAIEAIAHQKCSFAMARTIAEGWRKCYAKAMH